MLPTFLVIGTAKGGTSSLHHYLGLHPEIFMSAQKEVNFFVDEDDVHGAGNHIPGTWHHGPDWYAAQFDTELPQRGESSHHYTAFPFYGGVPARIRSLIPEARLIYLVRDPVERVFSHYLQRRRAGLERRELDAVMEDPDNEFVQRSCYHLQLEQYLAHFSLDQILVVASEDLDARRADTLGRIFRFLGVSEHWHPEYADRLQVARDDRRLNPLGRAIASLPKPRLYRRLSPRRRAAVRRVLYRPVSTAHPGIEASPSMRDGLAARLASDADRLRRLTGQEFRDWTV